MHLLRPVFWFTRLSTSFVIGQKYHFGFGFTSRQVTPAMWNLGNDSLTCNSPILERFSNGKGSPWIWLENVNWGSTGKAVGTCKRQDRTRRTSTHMQLIYLLYSSSHPSHVKNSIPYSQFLRLRRLCSEDSDFSLKSEEMCEFFDKRGYPASVVEAGHHRAQQIDRQSALQTSQKENSNRIPFTLTFHPHNHAVKSIILKNFKLLQNDPDTGRIFSQPPLISFKRDKHIGNFLVRSAFQASEQPGTFKCARARCKTCPFICNVEKLSGPKHSIKITDHFTCTSANVIYCITCTLCKKLYIGETGRRLGDRFREHLRDVEKDDKNASKPVARHFNLPNHSMQHMTVCGLSLHQGNTESRKTLEQKFIFQIGTLNPDGINERFSFN